MNDKRYQYILYTIVAVIMATIGIQVYWNFKNYQTNKQQLINDVQISLDKVVDDYYAALAERTTFGVVFEKDSKDNIFKEGGKMDKVMSTIKETQYGFKNIDEIVENDIEGITIFKGFKADSMMESKPIKKNHSISSIKLEIDSLETSEDLPPLIIEELTSKILVSIKNDNLDLKEIDSLLSYEFERKKINVDYDLYFHNGKENINSGQDLLKPVNNSILVKKGILSTISKSTFLPKKSTLLIEFTNETKIILNRILGGILISSLLVLAVISCLFYLLKIIKDQKQLAEVKNDLISNMTHEFKTPIATISAALESISNFNAADDKAKTKKYLNMSSEQLGKLNIMVEKLLETATLDTDNLELNKERFDISELLQDLINRYKMQFPEKRFKSDFHPESLMVYADVFHIENALNNILDNAVKYGGDNITIELSSDKNNFDILISDNGNTLAKTNKDRVFEKFYRVPKGNTHDVKGFGIGLYYTKTIIEKHKGTIHLELNKNLTTFKITLPNGE